MRGNRTSTDRLMSVVRRTSQWRRGKSIMRICQQVHHRDFGNAGLDQIGHPQAFRRECLGHSDAAHFRSLGCLNPVDNVFDHDAFVRGERELASRGKKNVGAGFFRITSSAQTIASQ